MKRKRFYFYRERRGSNGSLLNWNWGDHGSPQELRTPEIWVRWFYLSYRPRMDDAVCYQMDERNPDGDVRWYSQKGYPLVADEGDSNHRSCSHLHSEDLCALHQSLRRNSYVYFLWRRRKMAIRD